ncbi:MAG: ECF transporter S component [Clostridiales bacterium]|nr:ECF transporter S component [Clostridiales bacterium]
MSKSVSTKVLVQLALLTGVEIVFAFTPLGSIPIGPIVATLAHIPVIIAAVAIGTGAGVYMGALFGLLSMIVHTITPTITSFVFTPFYTAGSVSGGVYSVIICFIPRILLALSATAIYKLMVKKAKPVISAAVAGAVSSLIHTALVLGGIYLFFGESYAEAIGQAHELLIGLIMTTVLTNGIPEAIAAAIVIAALVVPLKKLQQ